MANVFSVGKRAGSMGVVRRILEDGRESDLWIMCRRMDGGRNKNVEI
jgi:hypothetical protein